MILKGFEDVADIRFQYQAPEGALDGATVHVAIYEMNSYDGYSLVVFSKDGKLWEVEGSHCSCFGLEGQWDPIETSTVALEKREFYGITDVKSDLIAEGVLTREPQKSAT